MTKLCTTEVLVEYPLASQRIVFMWGSCCPPQRKLAARRQRPAHGLYAVQKVENRLAHASIGHAVFPCCASNAASEDSKVAAYFACYLFAFMTCSAHCIQNSLPAEAACQIDHRLCDGLLAVWQTGASHLATQTAHAKRFVHVVAV